nr:MAG TPA: hypothetical protein [Caudoviricetes sp.]DAT11956.1 MAG TPA: hypothetical protein [Bacteriophage sp.]
MYSSLFSLLVLFRSYILGNIIQINIPKMDHSISCVPF